ncbi:MAG: hypothetical protein NT074_00430 [Methanomicrobiales archaeon]|nr:hypothetical protein [Methanomicrobiales archaeon]
MGDFIQSSIVKSATRVLATPLPLATANTLITTITGATNPFATADYEVSGETVDGCQKTSESYSGRIIYEDALAVSVGTINVRRPVQANFESAMTRILADTTLAGHMGGEPVRDTEFETYSQTIRCKDAATLELYTVTFTPAYVKVTSYSDDSILTRIEAWADLQASLA